jgi:hypothetical protein
MLTTNSAPMRLHELLKSMAGKDLAAMTVDWRETFLADTSSKFSMACEALPALLLGEKTVDRMWLWQCEPMSDLGSEVVATFSLVKLDHLDAPPEDSMAMHLAAAAAPGMRIGVDLLAEDSGVRGFGDLDAKAKLKLVLVASGEAELMVAEAYLEATKADFPSNLTGLTVHVATGGGVGNEFIDPPDIHEAFKSAAEAARLSSEEDPEEPRSTKAVFVEVVVDQAASVIDLHKALSAMGQFFTSASQALRYC